MIKVIHIMLYNFDKKFIPAFMDEILYMTIPDVNLEFSSLTYTPNVYFRIANNYEEPRLDFKVIMTKNIHRSEEYRTWILACISEFKKRYRIDIREHILVEGKH